MCHSDQTGCWTRVSPNRKEAIWSISAQFYHMAERYERLRVGWHCAKVKGHAELKIEKHRVKTSSYHFPKLHHSNPKSVGANVHLRQNLKKTIKVIERSRDVTPRWTYEKLKGHLRSPCGLNMCNSDHYSRSYGILKKLARTTFLWSATILKVSIRAFFGHFFIELSR